MKIKTSELIGAALNWAVASIEWPNDTAVLNPFDREQVNELYPFDKDWSLTGPLIKHIDYLAKDATGWKAGKDMLPYICCFKHRSQAFTELLAILRCFIASKLGDEVEVPDHLV